MSVNRGRPSEHSEPISPRRIVQYGSVFTVVIAISAAFTFALLTSAIKASASDRIKGIVDDVSGDRIMSSVAELQGFGSRAFYLNSTRNASTFIHDRFADLGLWVRYQDFVVEGFSVRNVIAVMNGSDPEAPQYLFGAHYDSANRLFENYSQGELLPAPGADDDASGVAGVIEIATVLHHLSFQSTLKFVAFAAEESGLNGSSFFVQHELAEGVVYADTAIMDMIGYRGGSENRAFVFNEVSTNTLSTAMLAAATRYNLNLTLTVVSDKNAAFSDHFPFWKAGYPSLVVIEELVDGWPVNPFYHTANDTANHLSKEQMAEITKGVIGGFLEIQNPAYRRSNDMALTGGVVVIAAIVIAISVYAIRKRKVEQ